MMTTILHLILRMLIANALPDADSARLRATAPGYLLNDREAIEHLTTARLAALIEGVDAPMLLSIAAHESHYQHGTVTTESGGRVSCGVLTPEPQARCEETTLLDEYRAGARHLYGWLHAGDVRSRNEALLGYAGGYDLIRACRTGARIVQRGGRPLDLCFTWAVFATRAAKIEGRAGGPKS